MVGGQCPGAAHDARRLRAEEAVGADCSSTSHGALASDSGPGTRGRARASPCSRARRCTAARGSPPSRAEGVPVRRAHVAWGGPPRGCTRILAARARSSSLDSRPGLGGRGADFFPREVASRREDYSVCAWRRHAAARRRSAPRSPATASFVLAAAQRLASFEAPPGGPPRSSWTGSGAPCRRIRGGPRDRRAPSPNPMRERAGARVPVAHPGLLHARAARPRRDRGRDRAASGRGVGSALMRSAEAWAREQGYAKLTLTVLPRRTAGASGVRATWAIAETLRYVKVL